MSNKRILLLFGAAGLMLAVILGVYFYRINLDPARSEFVALLQNFVGKINSGDLSSARSMMTEETRSMLREPGTVLGETVYQKLKLKSVESIYSEGSGAYSANVLLTVPDTLKIITKAGMIFDEKSSKTESSADPERIITDIYEEILSRDDIPMIDNFCVIRFELRNGELLIIGDKPFLKALEGNIEENTNILDIVRQ
ncbi:MAG: hypothetical protein IJI41_00840 [Anaerolineaceae bacterium]|nr:hypothetical protein [Anaerolineaceae bacterium]